MVQVATIFLDHFRNWTVKRSGIQLQSFVTRTNDLIAEREFKGRFAALTTGIYDADNGTLHLSNAGDNQLHIFRAQEERVEQSGLERTPAAGVFTSDFVPNGFPQETRSLHHGDILLLFTDGVEEAKRNLRDEQFHIVNVTQEMIDGGTAPEGVEEVISGEEFTIGRIHSIVAAVQQGGRYVLTKLGTPDVPSELTFDFSSSDRSVRDTVLAVVAAERVFRIYRDPSAHEGDRIRVDKTVDTFLQKHLREYRQVFTHREREVGEYVEFSHMKEDPQFDDITMMAIQRT
jgi:hypothetical protein